MRDASHRRRMGGVETRGREMHEILREGADLAVLRPLPLSSKSIKSLLPSDRGIELEHLQMVRLRQGRQVLGRDEHELAVRHLPRHIN